MVATRNVFIEILHYLITSFSKQPLFILKIFAQPFFAGPGELYDDPIYSRTQTFKVNTRKTLKLNVVLYLMQFTRTK